MPFALADTVLRNIQPRLIQSVVNKLNKIRDYLFPCSSLLDTNHRVGGRGAGEWGTGQALLSQHLVGEAQQLLLLADLLFGIKRAVAGVEPVDFDGLA